MRLADFPLVLAFAVLAPACGDDAPGSTADTRGDAGDGAADAAPDSVDGTTPDSAADAAPDSADDSAADGSETADGDTGAPPCMDLAAVLADDDVAFLRGEYPTFYFGDGGDLGLGGPAADHIMLGFFGLELGTSDSLVGTFFYGVDQNANLATASESFLLVEDEGARLYFARAGAVSVDEPPGLAQRFQARITDLEVEEVTLDEASGVSTPVAGGACYHIAELVLEQPCSPVCGDNVCGPDGCGGQCPGSVCAGAERCLLDGSGCAPAASCETIALPQLLEPRTDGTFGNALTLGLAEVTGADALTLKLDAAQAETVALDLASGDNASPATCRQCLRIDVDGGATTFFQSAGSITVNSPSDVANGVADVTLVGVRLQEVTIDADGAAAPLPDGRCLAVADARLATIFDVPRLVASDGWFVSAETPTLTPEGDMVAGAIIFTRASGVETRGGGGCLVADLNDAHPCASSLDCKADLGELPAESGAAYYCEAMNGEGSKRCWTRPGDNCIRSPTRLPGYYPIPPVPALIDGQATLWATLACMADDSLASGCASGDPTLRVYSVSPTLAVSP